VNSLPAHDLNIAIPLTLEPGAAVPMYASQDAAGADICACLPEGREIHIGPGAYDRVPTGIRLAVPPGYEVQVRPRSGLAFRYGITVLNAPGTIDSDYRGEVSVLLINHGSKPFIVKHGDRIAQLVVSACIAARFSPRSRLDSTERGEGGFGSTGI
jgi:dUTP pyrophosphatase